MFTMPRRGIVNVKMVITEEKILSNIEKVERLINPNSKKQIIELDENSYFKDLVESIKTYLIEYPKKKNFPKSVYDAAYQLVEYATEQFEENTKQIETLIKQREYNIKSAAILKQTLSIVESHDQEWGKAVADVQDRFSEDTSEALGIIGKAEDVNSQEYKAALKLLNAKVVNLESNLHIEIDMERVEDRSKALSYIGIEIADALKLIPTPAQDTAKAQEKQTVNNVAKVQVQQPVNQVQSQPVTNAMPQQQVNVYNQVQPNANFVQPQSQMQQNQVQQNNNAYANYYENTHKEVKQSLWSKFVNSKFMQAIKYAFRIKITLQLPEGTQSNNDK